jgi:Ubiquinol-cytochrome C chaperone
MADTEATSSNDNGTVRLSLKDRSLSITGKDVVMVAFVLLIGTMAYMRTRTLDAGLAELKLSQTALTTALHNVASQQADINAKQTEHLVTYMDKVAAQHTATNDTIKQMLLRLNYNIHHTADEQLSLDMDIPVPR